MKTIRTIILSFFLLAVSDSTFAQCINESHSAFANQGWLSCTKAASPIDGRPNAHWLMYDLGSEKDILDLRIWNHNVWGETELGVKTITVDVSDDKRNWKSAGTFDIAQAPGSWKYVAPEAVDLENAKGRHIVISIVETWDNASECAGIAEIKMNLGNTTATEDKELALNFSIYPSPAIDMVKLEFPENFDTQDISMSNSIGQIVLETKPNNSTSQEFSIIDLPDGLYHVSLRNTKKVITKTFVKITN